MPDVDDKKLVLDEVERDLEKKQAFVNILEFITNTFYNDHTDKDIAVELILNDEGGTKMGDNFYDKTRIALAEGLVDAFEALNLPRFIVYYHELGHHLYSLGLFDLIEVWNTISTGPLTWNDKYMHLLNWIEDYYIEDRIVKEYSYFTDVINCIKRLPPDYDINKIEYAFNFWYIHQAATPALSYVDQLTFKAYITKLLGLRSRAAMFGKGILTTVSMKQSTETLFALTIIEFYNWCVSKKIFPPDKPLPPLSNPSTHLEPIATPGGAGKDPADVSNPGDPDDTSGVNDTNSNVNTGSYSDHSRKVGKIEYVEKYHIKKPTGVFNTEVAQENALINKQILDMSQRIQTDEHTLDGLFSIKYRDSAIIQPKVIVPNFFNPNRFIDQVLFYEKEHTYMNVAIYRDISGSVGTHTHKLMELISAKFHEEIPVDIKYYLYSSGDISIIEVPYIPWIDLYDTPTEYLNNPLYKQLKGGTNSSAIADVISQQFSDKWLNIIITDGDLTDLMRRDSIHDLLSNVFVVAVNANVEPGLLGVSVRDMADIDLINSSLSTINQMR